MEKEIVNRSEVAQFFLKIFEEIGWKTFIDFDDYSDNDFFKIEVNPIPSVKIKITGRINSKLEEVKIRIEIFATEDSPYIKNKTIYKGGLIFLPWEDSLVPDKLFFLTLLKNYRKFFV